MNRNISKEQVIAIIEGTFKPFECCAELEDYENRVGFRVFDEKGQSIFNSPSIPIQKAQDIKKLNKILSEIRSELEAQGYELESWSL